MPWREENLMSLRTEFVKTAEREDANISQLCHQFGISRKTGYKWLKRFREGGINALEDESRRPHHSPNKTPESIEELVNGSRKQFPAWGGRKIKTYLERRGYDHVPAASTITEILRRRELINPEESEKHKAFQRFEMDKPNELWQMDFKGYFDLAEGGNCHPLTILDDHSRYLIGLKACPNETRETVQEHLTEIFDQYGLPDRMLMDNGPPWGNIQDHHYTMLTAWLIRLGIKVSHGKPYHPQTQGKDERLHRTLNEELIRRYPMTNLAQCQLSFDQWRDIYNNDRPHESLKMDTPGEHYQLSSKLFPRSLPPFTYPPDCIVRKVDQNGSIYFQNTRHRVGKAFRHAVVGLCNDEICEDRVSVFFCSECVAKIPLRKDNVKES
jgi:transposase InsO family protein